MTDKKFNPGDEVVIHTSFNLWNGYRAFVKTGEVTTNPHLFGEDGEGERISMLRPVVELVPGLDARPDGLTSDFFWTAAEVHLTGE